MGVPLQLILGILLVLAQYSAANTLNLRQIREAPPPSPAPTQNVTEINNRDLNKIVKNNPKTETTVDSKTKFVNNVHSYEEFPPKLGTSKDERPNNARTNETEEEIDSKEDFREDAPKLARGKHREDNSRSIGIDSSKFWSDDFHRKNVFTLPPPPDIEKFQQPEDFVFEGTRHPSFEVSAELTTPTTKIFDQKFKETVESVEQNIGDDDNHEHDDIDAEVKKSENESLEFIKTKAIVNNDTVNRNSIHKDINFEQSKRLTIESVYNNTKIYEEGTTKGDSAEKISTEETTTSTASPPSLPTTRQSVLHKELASEKSNTQILNNNIETEPTKPFKTVITSTTFSTSKRTPEELQDITITAAISSTDSPTADSHTKTTITTSTTTSTTTGITTSTTTISTALLKTNISEQENHVIPFNFSTESTSMQESSSDRPPIMEESTSQTLEKSDKLNHTVETRVAVDELLLSSTTEMPTSTEISETTTFPSTTTLSDELVTLEGTTVFIIENTTVTSDATTESFFSTEETTTVAAETPTTESGYRTSKSLENTNATEQMAKVTEITVETSTKMMDVSTESTIRNELDSTTLEDERNTTTEKIKENVKYPVVTTTEEVVPTSTIAAIEVTTMDSTTQSVMSNVTTQTITQLSEATTEVKVIVNSTENIPEVSPTTTVLNITTQKEPQPTTTKYVFIPIEQTENHHTTLLPETLSPSFNYSTTTASDNNEKTKIKKVVLSNNYSTSFGEKSISSSTTTPRTTSSTTPELMVANISSTTEDSTETPTENSYSKDDGGGDKGKIAAIAISSVGAVCLILLAGLLYVMKKRQKRLNYGPRCRPVSLDDYSIDNLSVYNSVRRKGGARLSKRSFGNPAFDDPVAPSHPLNFPALAKFSANYEDIKAEFEEIPQISARTSELPDGCETKNRYANVIPLPETRVYLKLIDGYPNSDYINANYVTGPKNTKGYYIATQGPMLNTVDDFWRMIWEQQAKVILMLTHLVENGLEKCVDYLPESEVIDCSRLFGDFQIVLKKQEVKDKYIISTLQLKNMVSNSWREVTHFWYLGWPEKGVPVEGNSLIAYLIEARSYMKSATIDKRDAVNGVQNGGAQNEHNPVVVHCSPGTGRTGVALACDIAIREFETARLVDIPKIVYRIRRDRAAAVQTKEQYQFIYKVVSLYATKLTGEALEHF